MRAWIEVDGESRQFLSRTGKGVVVSVTPVGIVGPGDTHSFHSVEIDCEQESGSLHLRVRAQVATVDALYGEAVMAFEQGNSVVWAIQWHRHEWVPADLPIESLNLASDARGRLVEMHPASSPAQLPDHVPAAWERLLP
jgi:hypothetical protein